MPLPREKSWRFEVETMTEEQRDLLCRGLTRLGVPYTPEAVERLGLY